MKCLIKETFATPDSPEAFIAGRIVDMPFDEAQRHEYNGLLTILDRDEHLPMAFETAEEAQTGREDTAVKRRTRKPKGR